MDKDSELYQKHARKYEGRMELMDVVLPILNCKWNDVIQFSALDPQVIYNQLKVIRGETDVCGTEYFKVHIDQIIGKYRSIVYTRMQDRKRGSYSVEDSEVALLDRSYRELSEIPRKTVEYWEEVKREGGDRYLWFPFIPHILVMGTIPIEGLEVCRL